MCVCLFYSPYWAHPSTFALILGLLGGVEGRRDSCCAEEGREEGSTHAGDDMLVEHEKTG